MGEKVVKGIKLFATPGRNGMTEKQGVIALQLRF